MIEDKEDISDSLRINQLILLIKQSYGDVCFFILKHNGKFTKKIPVAEHPGKGRQFKLVS